MPWTSKVINIDKDTGEVQTPDQLIRRGYEVKHCEKILKKLTETHNEIIWIKQWGPKQQLSLGL